MPAAPGVAQLLGPEARSLLVGRPADLRRWAVSQLGGARPRKSGRPALDLSPIAVALRYVVAASPFQQRLLYERLMEGLVPASARRDLKPAVCLHLDPGQRFPRITVRSAGTERRHLYGPFPSRPDAERAAQALNLRFRLRPCDAHFEPHPELPLGLGCLYATSQACAAPCLARTGEEEYRALARAAADVLAQPGAEIGELPPWTAPVAESRGLVVDREGEGLRLFPVRAWCVLEGEARWTFAGRVEEEVGLVSWPEPPSGRDDLAWLASWLRSRRRAAYLSLTRFGAPGGDRGGIMGHVP